MRPRRLPERVLFAAALVAAAGCREAPGAPHACTCAFLTDFDDEVKLTAVVCASTPARAANLARACAQREATAPVQSCSCARATDPAGACHTGACLR